MRLFVRSLCLAFCLAASLVGTIAFAKDDAEARTHQLLEAFKSVHTAPEGTELSKEDKDANEAAYKVLDGFFDYDRISNDPIAPNKRAFTKDQLARFNKMFQEVIRRVAYPRSGSFLKQATVTVQKGKLEGKKAVVNLHAAVPEQDLETDVQFHWADEGDAWRIVDVSFDGSSVVKEQQNQFTRIIKKEGVDGLLKKLSAKLDEELKRS